jgi:hypothetical protein
MEYVNWTGWKFMQVNLSDYPNASFNSIVIVKTVNGASTGQIFFDKMQTDLVTDIATEKMLDNDYILYQNYPNPFNPTTVISYSIPSSFAESQAKLSEKVNTSISNDNVVLKIYDILGREIATLVNRIQQAGNYQVEFDASNLTSGIYYYQLKFNGNQLTKKMLLLK